jgi:hypothetical protein
MVASKDTRNYTGLGRSPTSSLRDRSSVCSSVECFEVLTMGYASRRVERDCLNEVSRVHPLGRVPWLLLYRVRGQATYKELGSPDHVVVSLREGKLAILSWCQRTLERGCRHGLVPTSRHGVAWCHSTDRDDTVGMVMFRQPSCATWSHHGLRHRFLISRGHRTGAGIRSRVVSCLVGREAGDHDPELWGLGLRWFG